MDVIREAYQAKLCDGTGQVSVKYIAHFAELMARRCAKVCALQDHPDSQKFADAILADFELEKE